MLVSARIAGAASLKDRRQVVRSLTDRMKKHFNASIADLGPDGCWDIFEIAVACSGSSSAEVDSRLDQIVSFLERGEDAGDYEIICTSQEVFEYGDIQDRKT